MNHEQVRKAALTVDEAREGYKKAAKELLAAVEATPVEVEKAYVIINDDIGELPHDSLSYEENLAYTILEEVRCQGLR